MVSEEGFHKEIERLKKIGAKHISLKTGAYRPADLARAVKFASDAKIDLLTVDGAGGGTGMSPWRMMNEWGIPTIYLQAFAYKFASQLKAKGRFVPSLAMAGGFSLEDHIFKALALGSPFFKAVCMGRALMIPAFVGKNIHKWIQEDKLPTEIKKHGDVVERIFITSESLKAKFGKDFKKLPLGSIAMYTFCDRLRLGLQQLMAGARKFAIKYIDRNDLVSLTKDAAEITGIPYVMESDVEEAERILLA
jgi:glutamate synthase domain-containing protein 2